MYAVKWLLKGSAWPPFLLRKQGQRSGVKENLLEILIFEENGGIV